MGDVGALLLFTLVAWLVSGAAMNAQVCQEAVNKGYTLEHCWFNQKPNRQGDGT